MTNKWTKNMFTGSCCGIVLSAITVHYMVFLGLSLLQIRQKYLTWGPVWMIKANAYDSGAEWYNSRYLKTRDRPAYRTLLVSDWNCSCSLVGVCWDGHQATGPSPKQLPNAFMLFLCCINIWSITPTRECNDANEMTSHRKLHRWIRLWSSIGI